MRNAILEAVGVWRSSVARYVRDVEALGSNPSTPTIGSLFALFMSEHSWECECNPFFGRDAVLELAVGGGFPWL